MCEISKRGSGGDLYIYVSSAGPIANVRNRLGKCIRFGSCGYLNELGYFVVLV